MFEQLVEACQFLLHNYPEAQEIKSYLNARINEGTQNKFQFGYFPDNNHLPVLSSLIGEETLSQNKILFIKNTEDTQYPKTIKYSHFENQPLIMPYKDPYGNIVGLVGRSILSEAEIKKHKVAKYKNTSESKTFKKGHLLFGLYENKKSIIKNNLVYIVEGQFDVIKATEKGMDNIVGLGSANMTPYQFSVISRYTDNIILLLDNDEAGERGRQKIIEKFGRFANIQNFYLPEGYKDIDEYLSKNDLSDLSFVIKG